MSSPQKKVGPSKRGVLELVLAQNGHVMCVKGIGFIQILGFVFFW